MVQFFFINSFKFNEIIPFDKWKTTVLTKVKSRIPAEGQPGANQYVSPQDQNNNATVE